MPALRAKSTKYQGRGNICQGSRREVKKKGRGREGEGKMQLLIENIPCIRRLSPQYERQSKLSCPNETIREQPFFLS